MWKFKFSQKMSETAVFDRQAIEEGLQSGGLDPAHFAFSLGTNQLSRSARCSPQRNHREECQCERLNSPILTLEIEDSPVWICFSLRLNVGTSLQAVFLDRDRDRTLMDRDRDRSWLLRIGIGIGIELFVMDRDRDRDRKVGIGIGIGIENKDHGSGVRRSPGDRALSDLPMPTLLISHFIPYM